MYAFIEGFEGLRVFLLFFWELGAVQRQGLLHGVSSRAYTALNQTIIRMATSGQTLVS